jgi:hypothetical protein
MSFVIAQENGDGERVVLSVTGVVLAEEGADLFDRVSQALDDHPEVALDLRRCVFIDPSHLTSVLRLRRISHASRLSLVARDLDLDHDPA